MSKPRKVGAYANQRLNSTKLERLKEENQASEPDLGKSGRPGLSGGLGKRGHGGNGNPPCNRKGKAGNPPPTTGAPELYPDHSVKGAVTVRCKIIVSAWCFRCILGFVFDRRFFFTLHAVRRQLAAIESLAPAALY